MKVLQKIHQKLKKPDTICLILFYIFFVLILTGTILLILLSPTQTFVHYILYGFSAIFFTYFIYTLFFLFKSKIKNAFIQVLKKFKLTNNMIESYSYRTVVFSVFSFIFNIAYVAYQGIAGLIDHSIWYITISLYYLVLVSIKGVVIYSHKKSKNDVYKQIKTYRYCGMMLHLLTFVLTVIIVLIDKFNMTFKYADIMIYVVALYTFIKIIVAIRQIFKARKQDSLYIRSIRDVNFVNALYSIFVLQVAMFQAFGNGGDFHLTNVITGAIIGCFILLISIYMINISNRLLKNKKVDFVSNYSLDEEGNNLEIKTNINL